MKMPLVLLSGLLSNEILWRHQIDHLSDMASIQVISSNQNTAQKMVQAILEEAPPTFALAGHSMGGWLCLEVWRAAPSRVTQLCLMNTTARMDAEEKRLRRQAMILKAKQGRFPELIDEIMKYFVFNSAVEEDVKSMFSKVGGEAFINQEEAMLNRNECFSVLSTISCPTLVIHARKDHIFSLEEHKELAGQIPNAKLAVVEGSGHMSPMEAPDDITALLRFWLKAQKNGG